METGSFSNSIKGAEENNTNLRVATQDFLVRAQQVLKSSSHYDQQILDRYYRLRVNSMLDCDPANIKYINKIGQKTTTCIKCGNSKSLKLKNQRTKNRSWSRRNCRYLRSQVIVHCDKCQDKQRFTLKGRQTILDKLGLGKKQRSSEDQRTAVAVQSSKKPKVTPTESQQQPKKRNPPSPRLQSQLVNQMVKRKTKNVSIPVVQKPTHQFSSRLRAFTQLLEP